MRVSIKHRVALGVVLAFVLIHSIGLTLTPMVTSDEVTLAAAARYWETHGTVAMPLFGGDGSSWDHAYYWQPPGHMTSLWLAYKLFGFSFLTTRAVPLFFGALAISQLVLLVMELGGPPKAAVIAALLWTAHPIFWWACRGGRMDPAAMFFGLAAVRLWLQRGPGSAVTGQRAALAGALIGVASLFHVLGLIWGPALAAGDYASRRKIAWKPLLVAGVCAALPLAAWMAVIIARGDLAAWKDQFWDMQVGMRAAQQPLWLRPWLEFRRCLTGFRLMPLMGLAVIIGAVGWAVRRRWRDASVRFLVGAAVASTALVTFVMQKDTGAYPLYWQVWFVLAASLGWNELWSALRGWRRWAARALLTAGLLNGAAIPAVTLAVAEYQRGGRDYGYVEAFARQHIPKGAIVVGPPEMWYAVEKAGGVLRIWRNPDPETDDFFFKLPRDPVSVGFQEVGAIPERVPKIAGYYLSHATYAYELWISKKSRFFPRQP